MAQLLPLGAGSDQTLPPQGGDPFGELLRQLREKRRVRTQGVKGSARGYLLARLHRKLKAPLVCVAADEEEADRLASDLAFFLGGEGSLEAPTVVRLPADEVLPYDELSPEGAVVTERLGALFHLARGTSFPALVVSVRGMLRRTLPFAEMVKLSFEIAVGADVGRDDLARKLAWMGYQNSPLVEDVGTFSVRGDIIDVFSPLYAKPVRLEFFGDTVDSLRAFDPETQRTVEALKTLALCPARELLLTELTRARAEGTIRAAAERINLPTLKVRERVEALDQGFNTFGLEPLWPGFFEGGLGTLFEYLKALPGKGGDGPLFWMDDPVSLSRVSEELWTELHREYGAAEARQDLTLPPSAHYLSFAELEQGLAGFRVVEGGGLSLMQEAALPVAFSFGGTQDLREAMLSHHGEDGAFAPLVERLSRWRDSKIATAVACGSLGQADRLKRVLLDRNVMVKVHPEPMGDPSKLYDPSVHAHLYPCEISSGFVDPQGGLALLSDEEIFGARARRKQRARKLDLPFAQAFRDIKDGDLCVHTDFGICRYTGLTKMTVRGIPGDFLALEFAGRDKVYLPVSRMRLLQKFTGGDPETVQLDKLGTGGWEKTKKRVKEVLLRMAADLLRIYAARKAHPGHAFSAPDRYFRQFEADFEFEETVDQEKAISDVLADMQKDEPMDRLVCGDVGYGKTEVAMRAAFKATLDRKQVAVLVPTTVLAQQHYLSFKRRFSGYPVNIDVVSTMKKPQEVRETLKRAKEGTVDILIGTHKLLGGEVGFKDLGLLVVDEEQRFGVKHKEQLKKLRTQVDVLTLTATPIPRTLHMSMSGVRDMSIIATPPQDRRAIRTFVMKFDEGAIREAILREIARGGQVFFVHNRVESIGSIEQKLKEIVPEVSMGVAHGQMGEGQLEKVMAAFIDKKFQLLLCTSIIESGIDISSANTMIVDRADQFGLAQLYQLRGRVGRSKERAYAYLLVPAGRAVTKDAQRRLEVLQAFTELGAGFSIASHDLEIRGAGNLLGAEQSGSIAAIGFELYTQILEEAVAELRGEPLREEIDPEVNLPMAALIPDDYVPDVHQRLVFYKRFSQAGTPDEITDLRSELVDRFGEPPSEVDNLSEQMLLKIDMRELALRGLEAGAAKLVFTLGQDARLDGGKLALLVQQSKGLYRLTPDLKFVMKVPEGAQGNALVGEAKKALRDLFRCAREQPN